MLALISSAARKKPFPLRPIVSLGGGDVVTIQGFQGYQNITMGAPWVGEVSLLQDDYGGPCMPVQEMYSENCPCH